ncbi:Serine/threonine-protein phosphatase 2A activator 2 [Batrachochytrium dendrobatidis]|nr:Serine/threonine-protein phosphatase 2A activator 2 [Batrachochytrium dendrobatidis]
MMSTDGSETVSFGSSISTAELPESNITDVTEPPAKLIKSKHEHCSQTDSSHTHSAGCSHTTSIAAQPEDIPSDALPRRAILTKEDLERFQTSPACQDFINFLTDLNQSVRNITLSTAVAESPNITKLLSVLETLDGWTVDLPPDEEGKSRFGNPAFQRWYDRLDSQAQTLLAPILSDHSSAIPELAVYLLHSFGNRKRIDYGTGHEAHFIAFLLCLEKLGIVQKEDYPALVLRVFWKYIKVMRTLQFNYWLEPAGSHGVWGLDDYHFLPFLFGSSQLADHKYFRPKSIHDPDIIAEFSKDYIYFACIQFINSVKTASLRWHSPMLDDISGVKKWDKVNQGMIKMYKAEVLAKLPIMQHFLFGSLLAFKGSAFSEGDATEDHGHDHIHAFGQEHPTCCGMRVPSAIAAGLAEHRALPRRPLPFD